MWLQASTQLREELQSKEKEHQLAVHTLRDQVTPHPQHSRDVLVFVRHSSVDMQLSIKFKHPGSWFSSWHCDSVRTGSSSFCCPSPAADALLLCSSLSLSADFLFDVFHPPQPFSACGGWVGTAGSQSECSQSGAGGQHPAGERRSEDQPGCFGTGNGEPDQRDVTDELHL